VAMLAISEAACYVQILHLRGIQVHCLRQGNAIENK